MKTSSSVKHSITGHKVFSSDSNSYRLFRIGADNNELTQQAPGRLNPNEDSLQLIRALHLHPRATSKKYDLPHHIQAHGVSGFSDLAAAKLRRYSPTENRIYKLEIRRNKRTNRTEEQAQVNTHLLGGADAFHTLETPISCRSRRKASSNSLRRRYLLLRRRRSVRW
jgi:hypothetical protein